MAKVDIAAETQKVGNALTSVRIDNMILNLAKGIAWGQYELDKVGVDITKMMGVPGTVSIGGEKLSMLDAGFIPSFYHFVDTILEIKMEVKVREEENSSEAFSVKSSFSNEVETSAEVSGNVNYNSFFVSAEAGFKAGYKAKSTSAFSTAIDAKHSQTFSQDLSASSLMRTKLVPVPPPELLVERIRILLERLRQEASDEDAAQILLTIDVTPELITALDAGGAVPDAVRNAFLAAEPPVSLASGAQVSVITDATRWLITNTTPGYYLEKDGEQIKCYEGSQKDKKSIDQILMGKVQQKLMERLE